MVEIEDIEPERAGVPLRCSAGIARPSGMRTSASSHGRMHQNWPRGSIIAGRGVVALFADGRGTLACPWRWARASSGRVPARRSPRPELGAVVTITAGIIARPGCSPMGRGLAARRSPRPGAVLALLGGITAAGAGVVEGIERPAVGSLLDGHQAITPACPCAARRHHRGRSRVPLALLGGITAAGKSPGQGRSPPGPSRGAAVGPSTENPLL